MKPPLVRQDQPASSSLHLLSDAHRVILRGLAAGGKLITHATLDTASLNGQPVDPRDCEDLERAELIEFSDYHQGETTYALTPAGARAAT